MTLSPHDLALRWQKDLASLKEAKPSIGVVLGSGLGDFSESLPAL